VGFDYVFLQVGFDYRVFYFYYFFYIHEKENVDVFFLY
jgi:hypothetical protein